MADDLILDLTNYKDTVSNYVAPDKYLVVIEDAELGESSNKKTPQLRLWLRIVGGDFDGSTLVEDLYLTDPSMFRVVAFLSALGIKTPKKKLQFKLRQFVGRRVHVHVDDDTYNNRTRSRVAAFERFIGKSGGESDGLDELEGDGAEDAVEEAPAKVKAAPKVEAEPAEAPEPEKAAEPEKKKKKEDSADDEDEDDEDDDAEAIDLDELDL